MKNKNLPSKILFISAYVCTFIAAILIMAIGCSTKVSVNLGSLSSSMGFYSINIIDKVGITAAGWFTLVLCIVSILLFSIGLFLNFKASGKESNVSIISGVVGICLGLIAVIMIIALKDHTDKFYKGNGTTIKLNTFGILALICGIFSLLAMLAGIFASIMNMMGRNVIGKKSN